MKRETFIEQAADAELVVAVQGNRLAWRSQGALSDDLILALYANETLLVAGFLRRIAYADEVERWSETADFSDDAIRLVILQVARDSGSFYLLSPCATTPGYRFFPEKSSEAVPKAQGDEMGLTNDFGGVK